MNLPLLLVVVTTVMIGGCIEPGPDTNDAPESACDEDAIPVEARIDNWGRRQANVTLQVWVNNVTELPPHDVHLGPAQYFGDVRQKESETVLLGDFPKGWHKIVATNAQPDGNVTHTSWFFAGCNADLLLNVDIDDDGMGISQATY